MFDFVRKHNKAMMVVLFLLIVPSFVLVGVMDRYTSGTGKGDTVARVDGQDIHKPEWDAQHRAEADRLRAQSPGMDASFLDSDLVRYATLERMVRDRLLAVAAAKANITVSDGRMARIVGEDRGMDRYFDKDNKFNAALFQQEQRQTVEQYKANLVAQLTTQQVLLGVSSTAFTPPAIANLTLDALFDRREVQVANFPPANFASKVTVSDADIETYYKDHTTQFQAPEQASIEYLVLDLDAAKKNIAVSDADLKSYYEQNAARFGTKEERRASHILINAPASMPAAEREKAKAKAEQLDAEVKKAPNTFADVARKNSQDDLSAKSGGQLDMGPRGSFGSKAFEDAMFALKKGEISNVVETEFGYHVIKLDDIKAAVIEPFEKVRAAIENDVRSQQATTEFAKAAEAFTDTVYQQPDSLKPAADKLKLTIQTAINVTRTPAPGATGVLASRNFLTALFTADSLERKQNTEAIEIGANQLASGRVTQYAPAHPVPLAEVKEKIRTLLTAERAAALAKAEGEAKLKAWTDKADGATFAAPVTVSRRETPPSMQPPAIIEAALRADKSKLPVIVGVDLGAQGYAVVRVIKDVPRTPLSPEESQRVKAQIDQAVASAENEAYYTLLKDRFKAEILVPKPADTLPGLPGRS